MPLSRDYAILLLIDRPVPVRGSTVFEVTRDGAGWMAWLVDMDVPENTRALGPFRGRREARRAAKAAFYGAPGLPSSGGRCGVPDEARPSLRKPRPRRLGTGFRPGQLA